MLPLNPNVKPVGSGGGPGSPPVSKPVPQGPFVATNQQPKGGKGPVENPYDSEIDKLKAQMKFYEGIIDLHRNRWENNPFEKNLHQFQDAKKSYNPRIKDLNTRIDNLYHKKITEVEVKRSLKQPLPAAIIDIVEEYYKDS